MFKTVFLKSKAKKSRGGMLAAAGLIIALVGFHAESLGQQKATFHDTYRLDSLGNAKITRILRLPARAYAQYKQSPGDPVQIMQMVSSQTDWHEFEVVDARFDPQQKAVVVELEQKGMARTIGAGSWEIKSRAKPGAVELITCKKDRVILHGVMTTEFGLVSTTVRVEPPEAARQVEFDEKNPAFRYELAPQSEIASDDNQPEVFDEADWTVESSPILMACFAKIYGNENIDDLWTARSVFENSTGQSLRNLRIRFRVEGFGYWSPWSRSPIVYPNQTLVHGFFPVLDVDELAKLDSKTQAKIVTELEYEEANGEKIRQLKTRSIEIWPKNLVNLQPRQGNRNGQIGNQLVPMVVAAFNNYKDPAIQKLAGRISGMADGPSSALDSKAGVRYLLAAYQFLQANDFSYRASGAPLGDMKSEFKVSYPRQSLESKSFNELNLAVFWASVAKAVGMQSKIVVNKDHAFAVIFLANGNRIPIAGMDFSKSTLDDAFKAGEKLLAEPAQGFQWVIDTSQMEELGVRPLELSRFDSSFFEDQGFKFPKLPEEKPASQN